MMEMDELQLSCSLGTTQITERALRESVFDDVTNDVNDDWGLTPLSLSVSVAVCQVGADAAAAAAAAGDGCEL